MSKPLNFILNSDYSSLLNDSDTTTITVTIPAGTVIPTGNTVQYTSTATVGTAGSPIIFSINDSADTTGSYICRQLFGNPATANDPNILVRVNHSAATTVIARVYAYNASGSDKTTISRTITIKCRTFLPPFA